MLATKFLLLSSGGDAYKSQYLHIRILLLEGYIKCVSPKLPYLGVLAQACNSNTQEMAVGEVTDFEVNLGYVR